MKILKTIIKTFFILFIICNSRFNSRFVFADSINNIKVDKSQPLNITSNKVKIIRDKNEIIFIGNVKAVQDKFTLYSDKMIVKYKEQKNKKMDIESIKTEKNVRFTNDTITATSDEGLYNLKTNIITMKKNIKATESGITVFAEEFTYDTITGKTNIIGNQKQNERVLIILDDVENLKK